MFNPGRTSSIFKQQNILYLNAKLPPTRNPLSCIFDVSSVFSEFTFPLCLTTYKPVFLHLVPSRTSFFVIHTQKCTSCNKPATDLVVTNLQQCCSNNLASGCVRNACSQLVDKLSTACCSNNLLSSCNSTICQQVVSDNLVAT